MLFATPSHPSSKSIARVQFSYTKIHLLAACMVEAGALAMASRRAAAALLLIASLLVVVALSGADARPAVRPDKTAAALSGADVRPIGGDTTKLTETELHDPPRGPGYVAGAAVAPEKELAEPDCDDDGKRKHHRHHVHSDSPEGYVAAAAAPTLVKPECNDDDDGDDGDEKEPPKDHPKDNAKNNPNDNLKNKPKLPGDSSDPSPDSVETTELDQELCSDCEVPKKPAPATLCNTCEPDPKPEPGMTCNKVHAVQEGETCYSVGQCAGLGQDDFLRFNPNLCCDNLFVGQWVCLDVTCAD